MTGSDFGTDLSRRLFVVGTLAAPIVALLPRAIAQEAPDLATLKPGQFAWTPERAPSGPVVVLVSIPDQRVVVYRNGTLIGMSTCSTGKPGHTTPAGVFVILQKDKNHHSSTYNNASMPLHGAADLAGRRAACRQPAGLSRQAMAASGCRWNSPSCCSG